MKVKIGPYVNWFGPYQLAEKLCFWAKEEKDEYGFPKKPDWVHNFGEWLAHGSVEPEPEVGEIRSWDHDRPNTIISKFLNWIHDKKKQVIKVHIDKYDSWNMDTTLAHIVLPMLKQLKATKHGSPLVDLEDVPEEMRLINHEECGQQLCLEFYNESEVIGKHDVHTRWNWVLDEMIFAFESKFNDWDDQFHSGYHDIQWKKLDNSNSQMIYGPNDTFEWDIEGLTAYQKRIDNGFRLFGKYYNGLLD